MQILILMHSQIWETAVHLIFSQLVLLSTKQRHQQRNLIRPTILSLSLSLTLSRPCTLLSNSHSSLSALKL